MSLAVALRHVVDALEGAGAQYVVVGSAAAAAWGVVRSTRDIDVVMVVAEGAAANVLALLNDAEFYLPADEAARVLANGGSFNVLHPVTGGKVDVFVCSANDGFELQRVGRRVPMEVFGVDTWVATPEDIVLSKLRRRLHSRSEVQWRDCIELAAVHDLDREHLRTWASNLGVSADVEALLAQVDDVQGGLDAP